MVQARVESLIGGNPGDDRPVGAGMSELRIDHGPGYRFYYQQKVSFLLILLAGSEKLYPSKGYRISYCPRSHLQGG
jgi:putative addiction module killer protein